MQKFLVPVLPKMAALLIALVALGFLFVGCSNPAGSDGGGSDTTGETDNGGGDNEGDDTGNAADDGGGEYPYAEYFPKKTVSPGVSERPHIKIYFNKKIVNSYLSQSDTAFSITVGGSSQSFAYNIELVPPLFDTVGIWFNNDLPTGGIIKVSYDGTGVLAGKLDAFSDLAVSRK